MNEINIMGAIEALLIVAPAPLEETQMAQTLGVSETEVRKAIQDLLHEYESGRQRGFQLLQRAGGWRFYSNPAFADIIATHIRRNQSSKLSPAALETLAVIAYRQPTSRAQVAQIRGVNVDGVVRTLLTRGLIEETDTLQSGAALYGTTDYFLEAMGMNSLEDLPPLAPYLPGTEELEDVEKESR